MADRDSATGALGTPRLLGADPLGRPNAALVVGLARAGALAVLDLPAGDAAAASRLVCDVERRAGRPFAVRLARLDDLDGLNLPAAVSHLVLAPAATAQYLAAGGAGAPGEDRAVLAEVTSVADAVAAAATGAAGVLARGNEGGGAVADVESFVLLQQIVAARVPVWLRGGIGPATAAAAVAAGAHGVVLDAALALVREARLPLDVRRLVQAMDGSETRLVAGRRFLTRPDLPAAQVAAGADAAEIDGRLGDRLAANLVPLGQDAAFAAPLAARHVTAAGVVAAVRDAIDTHLDDARRVEPLAPGRGVARTLGTALPVVQGPMTRVSDRAAFAASVAEGGGLPFLALALLRGPEVEALLAETAALLGDRPWGVGILGFVPPELRAEQLAVVEAARPPVALVAGGRPSQAAPLEDAGIRTFLHAPSPGLVDAFVRAGTRRFVFEGRECGGHVGPRSSFVLWQSAVDRLGALDDVSDLELLFAGGIHDERSAAAVAALAAPLAARGAHVGVLMGTGYLFTEEAVAHGAITAPFQAAALSCRDTVLLETGPGHATRCAPSPYVDTFVSTRRRLEAEGADPQAMWAELEDLNLGRLRIASKGVTREGDALREVTDEELRREGMFMIGQVASLRHEVTTVAALHDAVTTGATARIAALGDLVDGAEREVPQPQPLDVAIVGMAAFLPGAQDAEQFWANVLAGRDAIREVPASRWDVERYYDPAATTVGAGRRTPSKWGGFLDPIGFDALRFGIPPASLGAIETVQLLALEAAARALDDAGYATRPFDRSRTAVIFGAEAGTDLSAAYNLRATLPAFLPPVPGGDPLPPELEAFLPALTEDSFPGMLPNVIAGRIANRLDLGGANYTVDAACAASLAALNAACRELAAGTSDMVLCGGADLHNGILDYLVFSSVHALSAKGRCATFDADADGIALGEGIVCLALKRREDAERDGDRIYAVIDAVAGASDGRALGLTAPRADGQRRALERAYALAGCTPEDIGLVEAHGTGTVVGDATELGALTDVYAEYGVEAGSVGLGSVKSMIGHTKCTAGMAGLVKAAQAVHRGVLPPTLHLRRPNDRYDEDKSPFGFSASPRPWLQERRRAGVSAFGFGGSNFHVVLSSHESAEVPQHGLVVWPAELVLLRAADLDAARRRAGELAATVAGVLATDPRAERHRLRDLARTVSTTGRGPVQVALVADDFAQLHRQLEAVAAGGGTSAQDGTFVRSAAGGEAPPVAFLFPGQGSQRTGMLADLLVAFPSLREHVADPAVAACMFPPAAFGERAREAQRAALTDTRVAQPALGVAELAMLDVLGRLGIRPAFAGGHSYGELVALHAAGVLDEDALHALSALRGEAVHTAAAAAEDPGAMAAVSATAEEVDALLAEHPELVLANRNGPKQSAVAGPTAAVEAFLAALQERGVKATRLPVACAFHSPIVAAAADDLRRALAGVALRPPALPVWSNLTAEPYPAGGDAIVDALASQVAAPVRFADQVRSMHDAGARVFVEVGPGRVLTGLVRDVLGGEDHVAVATDVSGEHGLRRLLLAVAELAALGVDVDPTALFDERADDADLGSWPLPQPGWLVDGQLVRTRDGRPVPGGLQPIDEAPVLGPGTWGGGGAPAGDGAAVVTEYLRSLRQAVAAERDVVLAYLGTDPASVPGGGAALDVASWDAPRPAAAAPTPEAPAAPPAAPVVDRLAVLLRIVGERTGYPLDMLDPDLDLEADLSIDSIKRIEIIGELAVHLGLPLGESGDADEEVVEQLARITTLRGIVAWLDDTLGAPASPAAGVPAASAAAPVVDRLAVLLRIVGERTGYPLDMLDPDLDLEADLSIDSIKRIEIIGELAVHLGLPLGESGDADEEVVEQLARITTLRGIVAWLDDTLGPAGSDAAAPAPAAASAAHVDTLPVPEAGVRAVVEDVVLEPARPAVDLSAASVVVAPLGGALTEAVLRALVDAGVAAEPAAIGDVEAAARADVLVLADPALDAPAAFPLVSAAALGRAGRVLAVTAQGAASGLPGLLRAVRAEVPRVAARTVAVDPQADVAGAAAAVVAELRDAATTADVAVDAGQRVATAVRETPRLAAPAGPVLPAGATVLLTGGARGITALVAERLAAEGAGRIVLVGRTAPPAGDEPAHLAAATGARELRAALLEAGELGTPAAIEAEVRRVLAEREVRGTVERIRAAGAEVEHHALDVRDAAALTALVADVRARHGRLDAIVHGAGVIEDRFLAQKELDSFRRVFDTKVPAARALLDAAPDDIGFVVLFGSVSGVFGNRGQVDYAAANDALDDLARSARPALAGRVLAVDWGPWAGRGMVASELAAEYARRGIGLLDPDDGLDALWAELGALAATGRFPDAQVVVARAALAAFDPLGARTGRRG